MEKALMAYLSNHFAKPHFSISLALTPDWETFIDFIKHSGK
jgi:hypothetical protein